MKMINQLLTEFYLSQWQETAPSPIQSQGKAELLAQLQHQNAEQSRAFDEEQDDAYWL